VSVPDTSGPLPVACAVCVGVTCLTVVGWYGLLPDIASLTVGELTLSCAARNLPGSATTGNHDAHIVITASLTREFSKEHWL